jgi:hypothetical protein
VDTVNVDELFRKEAWDHFRSAPQQPALLLPAGDDWRAPLWLLLLVGLGAAGGLAIFGRASTYAPVSGTIHFATPTQVVIQLDPPAGPNVQPGMRLGVAGAEGDLWDAAAVVESGQPWRAALDPEAVPSCVARGRCREGAAVLLQVPSGTRPLRAEL